MAEEKVVTLNLRKEIVKKPRWKRAKIMVKRLKEKIKRIAKSEKVKMDRRISQIIWKNSKFPTYKIKIRIKKEGEKYKAELVE